MAAPVFGVTSTTPDGHVQHDGRLICGPHDAAGGHLTGHNESIVRKDEA